MYNEKNDKVYVEHAQSYFPFCPVVTLSVALNILHIDHHSKGDVDKTTYKVI